MKLRTILLLSMVGIATTVVGGTVVAMHVVLDNSAERDIDAGIERTRRVLADRAQFRRSEYHAEIQVVASDPRIKAASTGIVDANTAADAARELRRAVDAEVLIVTDADGVVLADASSPLRVGTSLADDPTVAAAVASGTATGLWILDDRAVEIEAQRVAYEGEPAGVVIVGNAIDNTVAESAHRATGNLIVLAHGHDEIARSEGIPADLELADVAPDPTPMELDGKTYLVDDVPLDATSAAPVRYVILANYDDAVAAKHRLLQVIYAISAAGLLLALLLARTISHRLSRPVDELVALSSAVAGGALDRLAPAAGPTELRELAVAINHMVGQLRRDHDELERRVADRTRELKAAHFQAAQAQKLESVGRLAAGIAHEINTPTQFVSNNVAFLADAWRDIAGMVGELRALHARHGTAAELAELERAADLDYLLDDVPRAIDRSREGLGRVAGIVQSMRRFAHPDQRAMTAVDLNEGITSTLMIAMNELKHVADVDTDLGDLPPVTCFSGEINQAVLNILVNARDAIADAATGTANRGRIGVKTWRDGGRAVIAISDTGGGIPDAIRDKVFEQFFTTKPVGTGTGQGLPITRAIIVEKHGGEVTLETEVGKGTTFFLRIPLRPANLPVATLNAG